LYSPCFPEKCRAKNKKFLLIKLVIIAEKTVSAASYYTMFLSEMFKISLRINLFYTTISFCKCTKPEVADIMKP